MRLWVALACVLLTDCAPRPKRLAELRNVGLLVVVRDRPEPDGTRAIVFVKLGGSVPNCPAIRDDVTVTLDGERVPMFAAGGKLGDFFSRGVTCYDASFRSPVALAAKKISVEVVEGTTRLAADFVDLGARRRLRLDGALRTGAVAEAFLEPAGVELERSPTASIMFEYDADTQPKRWIAEIEPSAPGKPLRFTVPATARAGAGTLSLALGDFPRLISRATRCVGATECRAEIDLPRGEPSVAAEVLQ